MTALATVQPDVKRDRPASTHPFPAAESRTARGTARVAELILSRRCALDFAALAPLGAEAALAMLDEAARLADARRTAAATLTDALFALVTRCEGDERRRVLALKRTVHNDREVDPEALTTIAAFGDGPVREMLDRYADLRTSEAECLHRAQARFDESVAAGRRTIAELASAEDFLKGLHLSGRQLVESSRRYSREVLAEHGCSKPSRKMEARLVSFLYRMALKPSPFGAFVELRFHCADGAPTTAVPVRHVLIARMLLLWITNTLLAHPQIADVAPMRLNPLIAWNPDRIEFFRRAEEGAFDMFGRERFVALPRRATVERLLRKAGEGRSTATLVADMARGGEDPAVVRSVVEKLVECGAIERSLGIADQTVRYADAAAAALRALSCDTAQRAGGIFAEIAAIERDLATGDVNDRIALVERLNGAFEATCAVAGRPPMDTSSIKTYFYEEVMTRVSAAEAMTTVPPDVLTELCGLMPLIGLFDELLIERLALYHDFRERFGENAAPVRLLDFYKAFSSVAPDELERRMAGAGCPEVAMVGALRRGWITDVRDQLVADADSIDLGLTPGLFERPLPAYVHPWESASFYLQPSGDPFGGPIAMNGATMGHGAAMARFCTASAVGGDLEDVLRRSDVAAFGERRRADLVAVLGTNTNLHPSVWAERVEYPGSLAGPGAPVLRLDALRVSADPNAHRLVVTTPDDPRPLALTPLNALYPTIGPSLYRFLSLLSPYGNFRSKAWLLHLTNRGTMLRGLPRLHKGAVVLQRRCRLVDSSAAAELLDIDPMTLGGLAAFERWRKARGLPRRGFYSGFSAGGSDTGRSTVEAVLKQSRQMRLRKPHFFDFANPFLLRTLRADIAAHRDINIVFEESLPDVACYETATTRHAEEFIVQVDALLGDRRG